MSTVRKSFWLSWLREQLSLVNMIIAYPFDAPGTPCIVLFRHCFASLVQPSISYTRSSPSMFYTLYMTSIHSCSAPRILRMSCQCHLVSTSTLRSLWQAKLVRICQSVSNSCPLKAHALQLPRKLLLRLACCHSPAVKPCMPLLM